MWHPESVSSVDCPQEFFFNYVFQQKNLTVKQDHILKEVRKIWDHYDMREDGHRDDHLHFDAFYDGFMAPHFGCYRCDDARKALSCIDMDKDGKVDWNEFKVCSIVASLESLVQEAGNKKSENGTRALLAQLDPLLTSSNSVNPRLFHLVLFYPGGDPVLKDVPENGKDMKIHP